MNKQDEFMKKVEEVLKMKVGAIIAASILKNNLAKMGKPEANLTREDGKTLIGNIVKSVSVFQSKEESTLVGIELERLLTILE